MPVDRAVAELRRGGFVIIAPSEPDAGDGSGDGGDNGLLVQAAEAITPRSLDRLARLTGATPSLLLTRQRALALALGGARGASSTDGSEAADRNTVALSLPQGIGAREVRDIADPLARLSLRLPPRDEAMEARETLCAAAVQLTKLARLLPASLVAEIPSGRAGLDALSREENLMVVAAASVSGYEAQAARSLKAVSQARVPLAGAEDARIVAYRPADGGIEHLAIVIGEPARSEPVLARLHSECFTGDLLASLRCDCGDQLRGAIEQIAAAGAGILIYLAQEGRGIGLVNKLRAYNLQDEGVDTVEANEQLGFDADERIYLPAAEILRDLGFDKVRLLTNNPEKVAALEGCGIAVVERVGHAFPANPHNEAYLATKKAKSGHLF